MYLCRRFLGTPQHVLSHRATVFPHLNLTQSDCWRVSSSPQRESFPAAAFRSHRTSYHNILSQLRVLWAIHNLVYEDDRHIPQSENHRALRARFVALTVAGWVSLSCGRHHTRSTPPPSRSFLFHTHRLVLDADGSSCPDPILLAASCRRSHLSM